MEPDLKTLYAILREWAAKKTPRTYGELSDAYQMQTGLWFPAHGTWDGPLGSLNGLLAAAGAPALSALVILKDRNEPGGGFWGCASNVPPRPVDEFARLAEWTRILREVNAFSWPIEIPGLQK